MHKMQSQTVPPPNRVQGCLEGVFAHGQFYVLTSRVTDPAYLNLIGLPPEDLLDEVAAAWEASGLDVESCLRRAVKVTGEWEYSPAPPGTAPTTGVRSRLAPKIVKATTVPRRLRPLREILDPQPRTAEVLHRLLDWIDRADLAAREGAEPPEFAAADGTPIFPQDDEEEWWLTELERRRRESAREDPDSSDPEEDPQAGGENKPEGSESDDEDSEFDLGPSGDEGGADESGDDGEGAGEGTRKSREEEEEEEEEEETYEDAERGQAVGEDGPNISSSSSSSNTRAGAHQAPRRTRSRRGLENLGNTCYMNATVQAVCGTGNLAARLAAERLPSGGETVPGREQTRRLFQELTSSRRHPFSARDLHRWLRNTAPRFDNYLQHDAVEFFLEWRERLAAPVPVAAPGSRPVWTDWLEQWRIQPHTRVHCDHCGKPAEEPEKQPEPEFGLIATISADRSYTGVADALRQEHAPEPLETWQCDVCAKRGAGIKRITYTSAPLVLAVQLKRFRFAPRLQEQLVIDTPVPVEREIDLAEHLEPNAQGEVPNTRYRVRAIVEFRPDKGGLMGKGHYVCWVREGGDGAPESWIEYDDSIVKPAQSELPVQVHAGAYLLFYEQAGVPVPAPAPPVASSTPDGQQTDVIMEDA